MSSFNFSVGNAQEYPNQRSHDYYMTGQQSMGRFETPTMRPLDGSYPNLDMIKQISRKTLLASENDAFLEVYEENIQLKGELKSKDRLIQKLESTNAPTPQQSTSGSGPGPMAQSRQSDGLQIPNSPPSCSRDDYPDAAFWTRAEWSKHSQNLAKKGIPFKKLDFMTDEDGNPLDDDRLAAIAKEAKSAWATLHYYRLSPDSWGSKMSIAGEYFSNHMRAKFPEFRWCACDWKVDAFATVKYSEWKPTRNSGTLLRQNPSMKAPIKIKQENNTTSRKPQSEKNQKRSRVDPNPGDVIEVHSDSDSEQRRSKEKRPRIQPPEPISRTGGPTLMTANPSSATPAPALPADIARMTVPAPSTVAPSTTTTQTLIPTTTTSSSESLPVPPAPPAISTFTQDPPTQSISSSPSSRQNLPSLPIIEPVPTIAVANPPATSNNSPSMATEPVHPQADIEVAQSRTRRAGKNITNILNNMTIPTPNPDLLAAIDDTPPAPSSKTADPKCGKAEKMLTDNGTSSARNLYAIDYLKSHGPTTAAVFKVIWDNIDSDTAKTYKSLSSAAKKKT